MNFPDALPPGRHERPEPTLGDISTCEPPPLPPPSWQPPAQPRRRSPAGYIGMHWNGDLPLGYAYWVNGVLVGGAFAILLLVLRDVLANTHVPLARVLFILIAYDVVRFTVAVWQIVGILRSAANSRSGWAIAVNIFMVLGILGFAGRIPSELHDIRAIARGVAEQRKFDHFTIGAAPSGDAIVARGPIGEGYADGIAQAFHVHPGIHRLVLDSIGGDVDNGMQLHDFLVAHPDITVQVDHLCASACTLAFIGGQQRVMSAEASLGFHQLHSMIDLPASIAMAEQRQQKFKDLLAVRGASPEFIALAFAKKGNDVYVPNGDELFANHIITGLRVDDRVLTEAQWQTEQFLYAYRIKPRSQPMGHALSLIRQQWPFIYAAWIRRDLQIKTEPGHDQRLTDYNVALWKTLYQARNAAMRTVDDAHVRAFAATRRRLLSRLSDHLSPESCGRYLSGLSIDMGDQKDAFFMDTGQSYADLLTGNDPHRLLAIDWPLGARTLEQTRYRVAQAVPVRSGSAYHAQLCRQQLALLDQLLALPATTGDNALRSLFTQS